MDARSEAKRENSSIVVSPTSPNWKTDPSVLFEFSAKNAAQGLTHFYLQFSEPDIYIHVFFGKLLEYTTNNQPFYAADLFNSFYNYRALLSEGIDDRNALEDILDDLRFGDFDRIANSIAVVPLDGKEERLSFYDYTHVYKQAPDDPSILFLMWRSEPKGTVLGLVKPTYIRFGLKDSREVLSAMNQIYRHHAIAFDQTSVEHNAFTFRKSAFSRLNLLVSTFPKGSPTQTFSS